MINKYRIKWRINVDRRDIRDEIERRSIEI